MIAATFSPIYIGLVLLAALLCWFVIGARGKWWLKLPVMVIVLLFMFVVWASLGSFTGWPTSHTPPKASYYEWGLTIEPDPYHKIPGAVYVWLIPESTNHGLLDYAPKAGEPRAYKLPYSPQLEQQIQADNSATAHGQQVIFEAGVKTQGAKNGVNTHGHPGHGRATSKRAGQYRSYVLPPVIPTHKGAGQ